MQLYSISFHKGTLHFSNQCVHLLCSWNAGTFAHLPFMKCDQQCMRGMIFIFLYLVTLEPDTISKTEEVLLIVSHAK